MRVEREQAGNPRTAVAQSGAQPQAANAKVQNRNGRPPAGTKAAAKWAKHLYVIQSDGGYFKIGRSNNPKRRCASLQVAHMHKVRVLAIFTDAGHHEQRILGLLTDLQVKGEWFRNEGRADLRVNAILREVLGDSVGQHPAFPHNPWDDLDMEGEAPPAPLRGRRKQ